MTLRNKPWHLNYFCLQPLIETSNFIVWCHWYLLCCCFVRLSQSMLLNCAVYSKMSHMHNISICFVISDIFLFVSFFILSFYYYLKLKTSKPIIFFFSFRLLNYLLSAEIDSRRHHHIATVDASLFTDRWTTAWTIYWARATASYIL